MGKILWQPRRATASDLRLAGELSTFFSKNECYILGRYHDFRRLNPDIPFHLDAAATMAAQMIRSGCRHSYAATYVRTIKKLARLSGDYSDAIRLELTAKNIEFAGRQDTSMPQTTLSATEYERLLEHPSADIRLIVEFMMLTSFRFSDVCAVFGVHIIDEGPDGFLIKLHGGKNHRTARKVGKATIYKRDASGELVASLSALAEDDARPFTTMTCVEFNDELSAYLGRRVTSRAVRGLALHGILEQAFDADVGAVNYSKAALRSHHHNPKSLHAYHKRVVGN